MESRHNPEEKPYRIAGNISSGETISFGDAYALIPLQKVLALTYFRAQHPKLTIDPLHPDTVDPAVRTDAMMLWLAGDVNSLSARFRAYSNSHAKESISIDEMNIEELLKAIDGSSDKTVH